MNWMYKMALLGLGYCLLSCGDTRHPPEVVDEAKMQMIHVRMIKFRTLYRRYPTPEEYKTQAVKVLRSEQQEKIAYFMQSHRGVEFPVLVHLSPVSHINHVLVLHPTRRLLFKIQLNGVPTEEELKNHPLILNGITAGLDER